MNKLYDDRILERTAEDTDQDYKNKECTKIIHLYAENMELRAIIKYLEHKLLINNNLEDLFKNVNAERQS